MNKKPRTKKFQPTDDSGTKKIRLNKIIADSGLCSRRKADEFIANGKVKVNGKTIKEMGMQFYAQSAVILVEGKPLPRNQKMDIIFYKPKGLLTSKKDEKGRRTIYDSLPEEFKHLDPAGRLDKDTSGLLILSSDGNFIQQITHPSYHISKIYQISLSKALTEKDIKKLIEGVMIAKGNNPDHTVKAQMQWVETFPESQNPHSYKVCLKTGINRQIRKSLLELGYEVLKLKRISFGNVKLGRLKPGQFKKLRPFEKKQLLSSS